MRLVPLILLLLVSAPAGAAVGDARLAALRAHDDCLRAEMLRLDRAKACDRTPGAADCGLPGDHVETIDRRAVRERSLCVEQARPALGDGRVDAQAGRVASVPATGLIGQRITIWQWLWTTLAVSACIVGIATLFRRDAKRGGRNGFRGPSERR